MDIRAYLGAYRSKVGELFEAVIANNIHALEAAARLLVQAVRDDKLIYVVGPGGHSSIAAEEMFCRAGGLVPISPILEQGNALSQGALRSMKMERIPGYMIPVLEYYGVGEGNVLIVVNAYGMNCATIDAAIQGKQRGAKVIGISSREFSEQIPDNHPARHPSKKNLHELGEVDVHIDSRMPFGDAVLSFEGMKQTVGPVSTLLNVFVVNELVIAAVALMCEEGIKPPVWTSANVPNGDEENQQYADAYYSRIKHL